MRAWDDDVNVPLLEGEEIRLVDEKESSPLSALEVSLGPLADRSSLDVQARHVVLEISTPEPLGVSSVDNLDDQVGPLEHSPQLTPDLEVSLERRQQQVVRLRQAGARQRKRRERKTRAGQR